MHTRSSQGCTDRLAQLALRVYLGPVRLAYLLAPVGTDAGMLIRAITAVSLWTISVSHR